MVPLSFTLIGLLAGALITAAWVPQLMQTWKSRSARDISWSYLILFSAGVGMWELYGILRGDWAIILTNALTLALVLSVAFIKSREA
ncbi:MAG: SemiSWEET family sugar transporter [Thermoanaerobaculia bacterium]